MSSYAEGSSECHHNSFLEKSIQCMADNKVPYSDFKTQSRFYDSINSSPQSSPTSGCKSVENSNHLCMLLLPSLFPNRPPTVFFEYERDFEVNSHGKAEQCVRISYDAAPIYFRTHWQKQCVLNALQNAGLHKTETSKWIINWGKHMAKNDYKNLNMYQRINHFPGSWCIGRKDRLMDTLNKTRRLSYQNMLAYDFAPVGYLIPSQSNEWYRACKAEPKALWIVKPPASSCGRGIRVITRQSAKKISARCSVLGQSVVVQRYITKPLLINGLKFDLRLYVLVTSMDPMRVWIFNEGLVRFTTQLYTTKKKLLDSKFVHLTNYSVNKKASNYCSAEYLHQNNANKWSLSAFWEHLKNEVGWEKVETIKLEIDNIVVKTMLAADNSMHMSPRVHKIPHRNNCFELFGFDILIDKELKPWLLEVNISPNLSSSSTLDKRIKGLLMADTFNLVGINVPLQHKQGLNESSNDASDRSSKWQGYSCPKSICFQKLLPHHKAYILDFEDEKARAGHYRLLHPTKYSVLKFGELSSPRTINNIFTQWVLNRNDKEASQLLCTAKNRGYRLIRSSSAERHREIINQFRNSIS